MKRQYASIDIARYVSALLVVCIHTFPFLEISETFNTYFIHTVCRLAVPFFFTTSGFFFFRNYDAKNEQTREFFKTVQNKMHYAVRSIFYCDRAIVPVSDKACQRSKKAAYEDT